MRKLFLVLVGCGTGKHLDGNPYLYKIGLDRSSNLISTAKEKGHEVGYSSKILIFLDSEKK